MSQPLNGNKVVLGLSGGVDSTAAALLLKEKGMEVTGLYFDVLGNNEEGRAAAAAAAEQLEIDFVYKNVQKDFARIVINNFCSEYVGGRTPNPCIICNPAIKFKTLLEEADRLGAYYIATGHYANTGCHPALGWMIERAFSKERDQSYMLYRLGQQAISRLLLPLGAMANKEATRAIAREKNLLNAEKRDSQEICFTGSKEDYPAFIQSRGYAAPKGQFRNRAGEVLGEHQGLPHYTVGQRKGLGITFGKPVFVVKLDKGSNTVTLGSNADLFSQRVISGNNFFPLTGSDEFPEIFENSKVYAKIRYGAQPSEAVIRSAPGGSVETRFSQNQRAVTPGQSIVFYSGDQVIGGGFIE